MRTTSEHTQEILWRFVSPALPLSILLEALERETVTAGCTESVLRELRARPDLFLVLDPRVGPWRGREAKYAGVRAWIPDLWILGLRSHPRPSSPVRARVTETLRSLGRRVDQGSATATARWLLLMTGSPRSPLCDPARSRESAG